MKIAYICSRYADPDPANRRRNLAEARALARWAEAQGYAVVTWWGSIDPTDPPCDSDPEFRWQVLVRSAALATMVGAAGGVIIWPAWYEITMGMFHDLTAFVRGHRADVETTKVLASWTEVEPYYTAPVETVPRAEVQAAVDEMQRRYQNGENCINGEDGSCEGCGLDRFQFPHCKSFACIQRFTGVTPTEVTQ